MREIRTYGSEGGAAGKPAVPTPIQILLLLAITFENPYISSRGTVYSQVDTAKLRNAMG